MSFSLSRLRSLFRRSRLDREMDEELRLHVEEQTRRNLAAGMSPEEAARAARRQLGCAERIREEGREARGWRWLDAVRRDVRHGFRQLLKSPGFTAAAALSLALCLGANAAVFSMLYALVLRPLPFREPEQIVEIFNTFSKVGIAKFPSNLGQYFDFKENAPAFAHVGLWRLDQYIYGDQTGPARIPGAYTTADMFGVLDVQPLLGRFYSSENHVPAADKVVVLTESFWESQFQRDPAVLGRTIRLDGVPYEVIGVAPHRLEAFDARICVLHPMSWAPDQKFGRTGYSFSLFARLKPTASLAQARAEVAALEQRYLESAPAGTRDFLDRTGQAARVDTVQSQRAGPVKTALYLLQGAALFVLLVGCLNTANLLLARANVRRGEFALRAALGANRTAIARQLLVESSLIAALGAAAGLLLAWLSLGVATHFIAQVLPDALPARLDVHVIGYLTIFALAIAGLVGLLPAVHVLNGLKRGAISVGSRGASTTHSARAMSGALVVTQVAFALVLLTGAGLLIRSFSNVLGTDPGFNPDRIFVASIAVPKDKEKTFPLRLEAALRAIPDFQVSLATATPFLFQSDVPVSVPLGFFALRDYELAKDAAQPSVYYCGVTPAYRELLQIRLQAGRWFTDSDLERGGAVVVDETFARRYFPDGNAIGQKIVVNRRPPAADDYWQEIVGVAGNVRHNGLDDKSGQPFVYQPLTQVPFYGVMSVFIRTARHGSETLGLLRETVQRVDPELPIFQSGPLAGVISASFNQRRGIMLLLGSFAGLALVLASVGIYAVLAYDVAQRTREIGIRSAVGATRAQIATQILQQGLIKTVVGLGLGLALAVVLSKYMTSLLYEVRAHDPAAYATVLIVLLLTATVASWLPARRATRVDPMIALRAE